MDPDRVAARLSQPMRFSVRHTVQTGSTNDDLARLPVDPARWPVLIAEEQTAGRGRSGRAWVCPPGAGLMFSVRLPLPGIPPARRGWIGAVLGLSIVRALAGLGTRAELKWPNDVLIGGRKCAGILAETVGDHVVVGSGINVSLDEDELPRSDATSLWLAGAADLNREALLAGILAELGGQVHGWLAAAGDVDLAGIRPQYREVCATLGARVRIELPAAHTVTGLAVDVDEFGRIVVESEGAGRRPFSAGDITHLRTDPNPFP